MGKTIIAIALGVIGFIVALSIFLINEKVTGTVEDATLSATSQAVKDAPIDETSKQGINSAISLIAFAGTISFITGVIALSKKFF